MIAVIIIAGNTAALAPATICDLLLYIMPPIPTTNIMGGSHKNSIIKSSKTLDS